MKVIVTAGPTREWIDDVRFISNASSGKMGYELFRIARDLGYDGVFISGPLCISIDDDTKGHQVQIESTVELLEAVLREIEDNSILIMAAAPADYRPRMKFSGKIKKDNRESLVIELERNPDVLLAVKNKREELGLRNFFAVGFSAEVENVYENATSKLSRKGLDAIVVNDVSRKDIGFSSDYNEVSIIFKDGSVIKSGKMTKKDIAVFIWKNLKVKFKI